MKFTQRNYDELPVIEVFDEIKKENVEMVPFIAWADDKKIYSFYTAESDPMSSLPLCLEKTEEENEYKVSILNFEEHEEIITEMEANLAKELQESISELLDEEINLEDFDEILESLDKEESESKNIETE